MSAWQCGVCWEPSPRHDRDCPMRNITTKPPDHSQWTTPQRLAGGCTAGPETGR